MHLCEDSIEDLDLLGPVVDRDANPTSDANPTTDAPPAACPDLPTIYREYIDFVWSSARHLGASPDVIDDVVQDVFMVVQAKLPTLRRPESLRSWIYGILRRTLSDYRRARRLWNAAQARLGMELKSNRPNHSTPLEVTVRNTELEFLQTVLADLDAPKREIFIMVEVLEMTVPEVIQVLGIPLDTAYSRLRKARQLFEKALAKHSPQADGLVNPDRPWFEKASVCS